MEKKGVHGTPYESKRASGSVVPAPCHAGKTSGLELLSLAERFSERAWGIFPGGCPSFTIALFTINSFARVLTAQGGF